MDWGALLGIGGLATGVIALVVSLYAIRRDRPSLRLLTDAAAGTLILEVHNVGLRPVRVLGLAVRPLGRFRRGPAIQYRELRGNAPIEDWNADGAVDAVYDLPVVLQPGDQATFCVDNHLLAELVPGRAEWVLRDAAGHDHLVQVGGHAMIDADPH